MKKFLASIALAFLASFAFSGNALACVSGCTGTTTTTPSLTGPQLNVATSGSGWTKAFNTAKAGPNGTGKATSMVDEFVKVESTVNASGGPGGFCGGPCTGNNASFVLSAGVLAGGSAENKTTGSKAAMAMSGSKASFGGAAGAVWMSKP